MPNGLPGYASPPGRAAVAPAAMRDRLPDPVVTFLAVDGRADRLAAEHTDDGNGRCRTCPAGPQAGRTTWPCRLALLAAAAQALVARHSTLQG